MKKILVVDDEKTFLESLVPALLAADNRFNVVSADNGKKAVELLESESVDLVITDLKMPEMDGFELLAYMNSHFPSIPVVVMSAFGSSETKNKIRVFTPLGFLNKPFKLEELLKVVKEGLERKEVQGSLMGISLINFLQLVEMERKSCLLEVRGPENEAGYIYFSNGELYDASFDGLKSEDAVIKMLTLNKVDIDFKTLPKKRILKRINKSIISLIMEATDGDETLEIDLGEDAELDKGDLQSKIQEEGEKEEKGISQIRKETQMNVQKLNEAVEGLKRDLGEGLLATDVFGAEDGQSVAGFNSQPKACALFNQLTDYLSDALKGSGFPGLGRYLLFDLVDGNMVVVIPLGGYRWGMLVDGKKTALGLLLNIVIPKIIDLFEEALTG